MVLFASFFLFGLLGISDGYIYVPPKYTGSDFTFWLVDDNGDLTTNGAGILKAKLYADDRTIVGAGTVCDTDNRFTDEAARVICMQMGYQCAKNWKLDTTNTNLPALIDNVECTNTSLPFRECRYDRIDTCNRELSLKCSWTCDYEFSLLDSEGTKSKSKSGLLVASNYNGMRGTVCDDNFDKAAALTICREMGHTCAASWSSRNDMGFEQTFDGSEKKASEQDMPIMLDDVTCSAKGVLQNETFGESCFWKTESDCDHSEDIYLTCGCMLEEFKFSTVDKNNKATTNGKGLLIVESKSESGRELKGTVCDDLFDESSADTICKSMGFACSKSFKSVGERRSAAWGDVQKKYPVVLAEVDCHAQIQGQCSYSTDPICDHSEDILIKCGTKDQCPETPTESF